jgi:hypothetical protein
VTALAVLLATDHEFRRRVIGAGDLIAVMSEIGNESREALKHVGTIRA